MRKIYIVIVLLTFNAVFAQQNNCFDVARKGTLSEMKLLFEKDKNSVNAIDDKKSSMLILACYRGNHEVAQFLINNGADVDYVSGNGTALMACVFKSEYQLVDELLKKKG
jgi:uncharacterized protein